MKDLVSKCKEDIGTGSFRRGKISVDYVLIMFTHLRSNPT